jgi:hypothetical protein
MLSFDFFMGDLFEGSSGEKNGLVSEGSLRNKPRFPVLSPEMD